MKKLIISLVIILIEVSASAQRIHYYNPVATVTPQKQGTTALFIGVNQGRLTGEATINLFKNIVLTTSYSGLDGNRASESSPFGNRIQENLRILDVRGAYIKKLDELLGLEVQIGGSQTVYNYQDFPTTKIEAENVYFENVGFSENALHTGLLLHVYKGKSDIYVGLKRVRSHYKELNISHSLFDEDVSKTRNFSNSSGFLIGYTFRSNRFTLGTQLGFTGGQGIKLEQYETIEFGIFGNYEYTNTVLYSGLDFTSQIKVGFNIF